VAKKILLLLSVALVACASSYKFWGVSTDNSTDQELGRIELIAGAKFYSDQTMKMCRTSSEEDLPRCIVLTYSEFMKIKKDLEACK
jgi:hypothetical protein